MRTMNLLNKRLEDTGDAEPGDFLLLEPFQSLGNYIEAILVEKQGHIASEVHMRLPIYCFVFTIRHSLTHDNGSQEVRYLTHSPQIAKRLNDLTEGNLYRLSTKLKYADLGGMKRKYHTIHINRPEPEYELHDTDA